MQPNSFFFDVSGQPAISPSNTSLDVPAADRSMLLSVNTLIPLSSSIPSASSGSTSPCSAPFSPNGGFPFVSSSDEISPTSICQESMLSVPHHPGLPSDLGYGVIGWDGSLWSNAAGEMLLPEDLDIHSIPPIELGPLKFDGDVVPHPAIQAQDTSGGCLGQVGTTGGVVELPTSYHCGGHAQRHESLEGLFGFPELMIGQGF
jgi:hypothetical protein